MKQHPRRLIGGGLLAAAIVVWPAALFAQDSLSAARELYASAAYEDALAVLSRLNAAGMRPDDGRTAEQYRALCLLALGKTAEASQAIETVVAGQPLYRPSDGEVSPRVRAAFSDVRQRVLPGLVQQRYGVYKAAFDRKDYQTASTGFNELLALYGDPDLALASGRPPLSDLRVLIGGFYELSLQALAPPAMPEPTTRVSTQLTRTPAAPIVQEPRLYSSSDEGVVAPVALRQLLPSYPGQVTRPMVGAVEVVIDEKGYVVQATMRASVVPSYDRQVVAAAQNWRYRPAMVNGTPVKFRKMVQVAVTPQQ
jgi:tetratricopeptide (TPR) repeat protein